MTEQNRIEIQATPLNPVQYLACCGVFDIVSRFDPSATSCWILEAATLFAVRSEITEETLVGSIAQACTRQDRWTLVCAGATENVVRVDVQFEVSDRSQTITLDFWYETLSKRTLVDKRLKESEKIDAKSAWKMYAGRQTAEEIIKEADQTKKGLIEACREYGLDNDLNSLQDLLTARIGMTRRFGFDPRSSRTALDLGFAFDGIDEPTPTYPFAETLAMIGAQSFFPQRTRPSRQADSTRDFSRESATTFFNYCLWLDALPISLARLYAAGIGPHHEHALIPMRSERVKERGEYANLLMAKLTTLKR